MLSRKEALRQRLARKVQEKQKRHDDFSSTKDAPLSAFGIVLPDDGNPQMRLKGRWVGDEEGTERLQSILGDMDTCRRALNHHTCETNSMRQLILCCVFRIMECNILKLQLANGDVILDPTFSIEEYLSAARSLSIHRHALCLFTGKRVAGDIPAVTEDSNVDVVRDVIIHEVSICVRLHELIDEDGPVPTVTHALQWLSRWNVIFKRLHGALSVKAPLAIEIVHDYPRPDGVAEPFRAVPLLRSVEFHDVTSQEGIDRFFTDWAKNARFPPVARPYDAEAGKKFMRAQWERFLAEDDD
jgi:hypothetical protein